MQGVNSVYKGLENCDCIRTEFICDQFESEREDPAEL